MTVLGSFLFLSQAYADDHIGGDYLQFAPSISLGSEYRTNLYLQEGLLETSTGDSIGQPLTSGTAILINPDLKLKYKNGGIKTVLGLNYRAKKYISSDQVDLSGLDRFRDAQVLSEVELLPIKQFGLSVQNTFLSSGRETSADDTGSAYIQSLNNNTQAGLVFRPGSALEFSGGASYTMVDVTDAQSAKDGPVDTLNNKQALGWYTNIQWKFFPRTSIFAEVAGETFDWQYNLVFNESTCSQNLAGDCELVSVIPNGSTTRAQAGISGRFSDRLLLKLALNYGMASYDTESISEGVALGQTLTTALESAKISLEGLQGLGVSSALTYMFSDTHSILLAYDKDFMDVYFTNFSVYNQFRLEHSVNIMNRVTWKSNFRYRVDSFEGIVTRDDTRISVNSSLRFRLMKQIDFTLGGGWSQLASTPEFFDIEYDDLRVHGGLVVGY